jgi:hypothetical protein
MYKKIFFWKINTIRALSGFLFTLDNAPHALISFEVLGGLPSLFFISQADLPHH